MLHLNQIVLYEDDEDYCPTLMPVMSFDSSSGAAGPGVAVARGPGGVTDVCRSHGGEAESRDSVPEGADPGGAVSEGEPGGHSAAGDRGL